MAPAKRLKTDSPIESGSSNDLLVEPPSEEVPKRKIARRSNSQESKVEPASSSLPKEANDANKNEVTQKKAKVEKPQTNMLDMNDHSLYEMMHRMDLRELCTMAEVSVQLKETAQEVFIAKHRAVSLTSLADPANGKYTLPKVRQLLYNFGHLITTLTIDDASLDDHLEQYPKLLHLVRKYCMETIEKVVFLNQPGGQMDSFIMTLIFGQEVFFRNVDIAQNRHKSITQTTFETHKITQEQILLTDA